MPKERPTAEQMAQRRTDRLTRELGLNQTQAKEVYALKLQQMQQMQSMREQMRKNRSAAAEKMKSVLTPEQFAKWSQMQGPKPCEHRGRKCDGKDAKMGCCRQKKDGCKAGKSGCCTHSRGDCNGRGSKDCAKQRPAQARK